jgi:hypothetical protein
LASPNGYTSVISIPEIACAEFGLVSVMLRTARSFCTTVAGVNAFETVIRCGPAAHVVATPATSSNDAVASTVPAAPGRAPNVSFAVVVIPAAPPSTDAVAAPLVAMKPPPPPPPGP